MFLILFDELANVITLTHTYTPAHTRSQTHMQTDMQTDAHMHTRTNRGLDPG